MTEYRAPSLKDLPQIMALAKEMHAETSFNTLTFDESKAALEIATCIMNPTNFVCVAEKDGQIVGIIGVYMGSPFFSSDPVVYDHIWYVSKSVRGSPVGPRLLKIVGEWAEMNGAKSIFLTLGSEISSDRVGKLAERFGYRQLGGYYRKDLGDVQV